ncbi:TetR family transcriptional regulator, partial [Streptomyces sp. T-3]|nr:TetR family transcriptional regulator [Streptomyces sp. T-3]
MARRYDPERRQRIIDAAIRVVGRKGIAGLSHRSVAAEADVPLGSTTYHFKTLDDLMVAALRQTNEGFAKAVQNHGALEDPQADLAAELAALTGEWLGGDRPGVELEYELYLAALRRPALRPVAAEWCE